MKFSVTETIWEGRNANRKKKDTGTFPPKITVRRLEGEPFNVLFLSKRGISRAPMAREAMRHLVRQGNLQGAFRIKCRGIRPEYDSCPIDLRMREVSCNREYSLPAFSKLVKEKDLKEANLILAMGIESVSFVKENKEKINGSTRPFEQFLPAGSEPFLPDPFLQRTDDYETHYSKLIASIEEGCQDLLDSIPFLS